MTRSFAPTWFTLLCGGLGGGLCAGIVQAQEQRWQQLLLVQPYGDIAALLHPSAQSVHWQWVQGDFPNPGFSPDGYWFRLTVPATAGERQVLWIRNGIYATLDVYLVQGDAVLWHRRGAADNRTLFDDMFVLGPLTSSAGDARLYLRATSAGVLQLPAQLISETELLSVKEHQDFAFGVLIGVLLVLTAYFFVLYLIVRDQGFLYYVLHSVFTIFLISLWHGFDRAPWWPSATTSYLLLVVSQLVVVCMVNLTLWFLRQLHSDNATARALRLLRNAALLLALATPALLPAVAITCSVATGGLMAFGVSIALLRYGNFRELTTRLFTLGWMLFLPSTLAMLLYRLGFIGLGMDHEILAYGGWVAEMVLQGFALAVRYDMDQREKLSAQQQAITARERESAARSQALHHEQQARRALQEAEQAQRDYSETLEQRVRQRSSELEHIQQELAAISITDALTGLHNRRFFTERFEQEVVRMRQLNAGLSLMLIDVDHFKRINDSHGHLAGDECLQQVAARLKSQLKRPSDVLCRYGGEEFAVLLPDTPLPGALAFAHAIRDVIAATPLQCEGVAVDVSISVGLLVTIADNALSPEQLLHQTDQALYQAKRDGRNCVRVAD